RGRPLPAFLAIEHDWTSRRSPSLMSFSARKLPSFGAAGRLNYFFVWSTKRFHQTLSTFYSRAISLHGRTRFAVFQLRPAQAIRCSRRRPQPFLILPQLSRQILLS